MLKGGGYGSNGLSNGVLWTVFADVFFYILTPLIYKLLCNKADCVWFSVIFVGWLLNVFDNEIIEAVQSVPKIGGVLGIIANTVVLLYEFLIGSYLYFRREQFISWVKRHKVAVATAWIAFAIFHWLWVYQNIRFGTGSHPMHSPWVGVWIPWLTIAAGYALIGNSNKALKLGDWEISYGIFLNHMIVVGVLMYLGIFSAWGILVTIAITPVMAIVSKQIIEKPSLKLKIRSHQ